MAFTAVAMLAYPVSTTMRMFASHARSGLTLVEPLRACDANMRIVVLTGYASIATAVKAIKLGADDYLAKPVTASAVADALLRNEPAALPLEAAEPMSPRRL